MTPCVLGEGCGGSATTSAMLGPQVPAVVLSVWCWESHKTRTQMQMSLNVLFRSDSLQLLLTYCTLTWSCMSSCLPVCLFLFTLMQKSFQLSSMWKNLGRILTVFSSADKKKRWSLTSLLLACVCVCKCVCACICVCRVGLCGWRGTIWLNSLEMCTGLQENLCIHVIRTKRLRGTACHQRG